MTVQEQIPDLASAGPILRILHILLEPSHANGSGARLRSRALGHALARHGRVTTLVLSDILPAGMRRLNHYDFRIMANLPEGVLAAVSARAKEVSLDLVVVETAFLADVAHRLTDTGHRVILDAHNVESDLRRQIDRSRRGLVAPLRYRRRWRRASAAEAALLRHVAAVWACSAEDRRQLVALEPDLALASIVPNPVPDWCHRPVPPSSATGIVGLFLGHLGYRPNIHAAERLALRIWPRLRATRPDARLLIAGRAPEQRCRALGNLPGLDLHADPPDVAPLYGQANMVIIPLREGGGTRIKVLEALASGRPVIATAKAVEGLGLIQGKHFLQAETDDEFINTVQELADDIPLAEHLRHMGREFVMRHHGVDAIEAAVSRALRELQDLAGGVGHEPAGRSCERVL